MVDVVSAKRAVRQDAVTTSQQYVLVAFENVDTVADHRLVQGALDKLTVVETALLFQLEPARATFKLKLRSGLNELQKQIKDTGKFRQVRAPVSSTNAYNISNANSEVYHYRLLN